MEMIDIVKYIIKKRSGDLRINAFGVGFYRWVQTYEIVNKTGFSFRKVRRILDKEVERDRLLRKKNGYVFYSVKSFEGYSAFGDYFNKL